MNQYKELKDKFATEVNNFPKCIAFTNEDLKDGLIKLGLKTSDTDKLISLGAGVFIRKSDKQNYINMGKRHQKELCDNINKDKTGNGFILDMFCYELANHEYVYTHCFDTTLEALNITYEDLKNNDNLVYGLNLAKEKIVREYEESCYEY